MSLQKMASNVKMLPKNLIVYDVCKDVANNSIPINQMSNNLELYPSIHLIEIGKWYTKLVNNNIPAITVWNNSDGYSSLLAAVVLA